MFFVETPLGTRVEERPFGSDDEVQAPHLVDVEVTHHHPAGRPRMLGLLDELLAVMDGTVANRLTELP